MEDLGGSGRRWEKLGGFETSWKDPAGGRRIWEELGGDRSSWEELGVVNRKTIDNMNAVVTIRLLLKTHSNNGNFNKKNHFIGNLLAIVEC